MQHSLLTGLIVAAQVGMAGEAFAQQGQTASASNPGYVVSLKGDTLRGVLTIPRFASAAGVKWQPVEGGPTKIITPADCRALGYRSGPRFVASKVRLSAVLAAPSRKDSSAVFLQSLVQGQISLYKLNYRALREPNALDYAPHETTFFWVQQSLNAPLQLLSEETFRSTLAALLGGCDQLHSLLQHTRFQEDALVGLVLAMDRTCAPTVPTVDWRPVVPARPLVKIHLGIIGSYHSTQVCYPETQLLSTDHMQAQSGLSGGLVLTAQRPGKHLGLETGLNLAVLRSRFANAGTVPAGYANTGQQLESVQQLQVTRLQVPLLAAVHVGDGDWTPWLSVGPTLGFLFNDKSRLEIFNGTNRPGEPLPRLEVRQQVLQGQATGTTFCLGALLGVGFRPQIGRLQALGRVQYEFGQQVANVAIGALQLRGFSVTGGILF